MHKSLDCEHCPIMHNCITPLSVANVMAFPWGWNKCCWGEQKIVQDSYGNVALFDFLFIVAESTFW